MVQTPLRSQTRYPDSDGKPMAENTEQYQWITRLVTNLKHLLREQTAFVAGDLLWYPAPAQADETPSSQAPDAMVVLGRPDGRRGSYQQWKEGGIAPQVVFEIISPSNTAAEMVAKQSFYARQGALEMYFYDPDAHEFWGLVRDGQQDDLKPVMLSGLPWVSPLLKIRFEMFEDGLAVFHPDGEPFKDPEAFALGEAAAKAERDTAQAERDTAQAERDTAQAERDTAQTKLEQAIAQMQAAGLDTSNF